MTAFQRFSALMLCAAFLTLAAAPAFAQIKKNADDDDDKDKPSFFESLNKDKEEEEKAEANAGVYQYDDKYRTYKGEGEELSLLGKSFVSMVLLRPADAAPGEFVMRVGPPGAVTGCIDITPPEVEIRKDPPILVLNITHPAIGIDKTKRYPHYECDTSLGFAYTDIPLYHDDLLADGIKKIALRSKEQNYEDIEFIVGENNIEISSPHQAGTYWFYPENTVILQAPALKPGENVKDEILKLGRAKGLVPLVEILEDFEPHDWMKNAVYFLDPMGVLAREIAVAGKPVFVGHAKVEDTYYGPNGAYKKPRDLQLYAKLPGENE